MIYVLILMFPAHVWDVNQHAVVPGFKTEAACMKAGPIMVTATELRGKKTNPDEMTRAAFRCVGVSLE